MPERFARQHLAQVDSVPPALLLQQAFSASLAVGHKGYGLEGDEIFEDFQQEGAELVEAVKEGQSRLHIRNEIGDVLQSLVALCRVQNLTLEDCMYHSTKRWLSRKAYQEEKIFSSGHTWRTVPEDLLRQYWKDAKRDLKQAEYSE